MNRHQQPDSDGRGHDAPRPATGRRHRRAVRPGVELPSTDEKAWEDDERAWGDLPEDREERLRRDIPPHWG